MSDNSPSQRAGGPFDRGLADYYYNRARFPHYFLADGITRVSADRLTATEREEYHQGYAAVKVPSARKNWEY
jgi:hypothetical protein|tara:strand:- start:258 stop:473 length:216 start_codon:yes stop_codon:yes gene_type:complete